jgi:hypothetical protein
MTYEGNWYSNVFGRPDDLSFVIRAKLEGHENLVDITFLYMPKGKRHVQLVRKSMSMVTFRLPMKAFEITDSRAKERLIGRIFTKIERGSEVFTS